MQIFWLLFAFMISIPLVDGCFRAATPSQTTTQAPVTTTIPITTTTVPRPLLLRLLRPLRPLQRLQRQQQLRQTTTTTLPPCTAPDNSAGITIDTGTSTRNTGLEQQANAHCTSCDAGNRNWYTSATTSDPQEAQGNAEVAITTDCSSENLCVCNAGGSVCCQPSSAATVPDSVQMIPLCQACQMNAFLSGNDDAGLTCTDMSMFTVANQFNADGSAKPMNTAAYFPADSVSCNGCSAIMNGRAMKLSTNKKLF
ncbi:hypothetical protein M3Y98_00017600 [Aphelenchoides besseyi]|nr:hypothetical protein M3Y98_00017600 [Aphelenchoides besseyi]